MLDVVNLKINDIAKRLNRLQDRQDLESIRQLIIILHDENDRLKAEAAMQSYGNSEQINDMHEQIHALENKAGYYR